MSTLTLWRLLQLQLPIPSPPQAEGIVPFSPTTAVLSPLLCPGLQMEHLGFSISKALAAFWESNTDPNIEKAKFRILVAS